MIRYLAVMMEYLTLFKDWVIALGEKHEVDPLLLGSLYLISKISLVIFLGLTLKNVRAKKQVTMTLLFAGISFSIPYLYLIIAGRNLSIWVYVIIALIFIYGAFSIWKKITTKPATLIKG